MAHDPLVMSTPVAALEVEALTKEYGHRPSTRALHDVTLSIGRPGTGTVHALVGPNGSGKTTLIRCVLGLVRPSSGRIRVLGAPVPGRLHDVIRQVGVVTEQPRLCKDFTGRLNLLLAARIDGLPAAEIDRVLELVDMADRADDRLSEYSMGMKQRISLAVALLRRPSLLILDEPTNGLDPFGVLALWRSVADVAGEGCTVLISSHNLADLERGCTHASLLHGGRVLADGSLADLRSRVRPERLRLRVRDPTAASKVLTSAGIECRRSGEDSLAVHVGERCAEEVCRLLAGGGIFPIELVSERASLEDVFVDLIPPPGQSAGSVEPGDRRDGEP